MSANWSQEVFIKAWDFSTVAHQNQSYGRPEEGQQFPYINHIGAVTMEVIWALTTASRLDGDLAVQCALLHDTIEDSEVTYEMVAAEFGQAVAEGVLALTKNDQLATNREQMVDSLKRIKQQPYEVWIVKLADRITNLSEPPYYWEQAKRKMYQQEARLIYDALHPANERLAARLLAKIENFAQYF